MESTQQNSSGEVPRIELTDRPRGDWAVCPPYEIKVMGYTILDRPTIYYGLGKKVYLKPSLRSRNEVIGVVIGLTSKTMKVLYTPMRGSGEREITLKMDTPADFDRVRPVEPLTGPQQAQMVLR